MTVAVDWTVLLRAEIDRREIVELTHRYAAAVDDRDWPIFGAVFVEDAEATYEDEYLHSRHEIVAYVKRHIDRCSVSHHTMTNHVVELSGDCATIEFAGRAHHRGSGDRSDLVFDVLSRYRGKLYRTEHGWQIYDWALTTVDETGTRAAIE